MKGRGINNLSLFHSTGGLISPVFNLTNMDCLFPTCNRHAESTGYCLFHKIYSSSSSVKVPKPISKKSEGQKEIDKYLKKKYPLFLSKLGNKYCKANLSNCTKVATVVHHLKSRAKDVVLDEKYWLAVCPNCNIEIESKDGEARKKGLKLSKLS